MKILALDAALGPFSAALDLDGRVRSARCTGNDALERGLGQIAGVLDAADLRLTDLDRIAVGIGPGSFTGIRIALSFAKSLAFGAGLPVVGISSYDVLTPPDPPLPCLTVVGGRPGVVCARLLATSGEAQTACGPVADVVERLLAGALDSPLALVTNTEDVLSAIGETQRTVLRLNAAAAETPAAAIALLARERDALASVHALAPDYGELPAVTRPKTRAAGPS